MEEPVRIGLVFPRSGQQLFVHVPRRLAESAQSPSHVNYMLCVASREQPSHTPMHDDPSHRQH